LDIGIGVHEELVWAQRIGVDEWLRLDGVIDKPPPRAYIAAPPLDATRISGALFWRLYLAPLSGAFIRCVCPVHCRRGMAGPRHMPLQPRLCPSHGANKAAMPRNEKKPTPSVTVVRMIEAAVAGSCPKRRSSTSA